MPKIIASSRPSTKPKASSASMQRVTRTTATPTTASATIGAMFSADSPTIPASTTITIGAWRRR